MNRELSYYEMYKSPLGELYLIFTGNNLVGIEYQKPHLRVTNIPESFIQEIKEYFDGNSKEFSQSVQLDTGTEFERKVWTSLSTIPYGETRSYKWLAQYVGSPKGTRAVGRALSKNPIPIVLPCHRIIESNGKLGGFAWGSDIKRRLLSLEFYNTQ
jgi:methylated-DNA-[protein]-cysteine S-methyltransferase